MTFFEFLASLFRHRSRPSPIPPPPVPAGDPAAQLLVLHNARRPASAPLRLDPRLMRAAGAHAQEMADRGVPEHSDLAAMAGSVGYAWADLGENIAEGQPDAPAVFAAWMGDAGHRRNIEDPAFRDVGFGRAVAAGGAIYWCADFGTPA